MGKKLSDDLLYERDMFIYAYNRLINVDNTAVPIREAVHYRNASIELFLLHASNLYKALSRKKLKQTQFGQDVIANAAVRLYSHPEDRADFPQINFDAQTAREIQYEVLARFQK